MQLLGFGLTELLGLMAVAGGLTTLLYLLDRARRKQRVSTLRFYQPAASQPITQARRTIREPLSLLLQMLAILSLLLAMARLYTGSLAGVGRDHVLLLDVSAIAAAKSQTFTGSALAWLDRLPAADRVMLALAAETTRPITGFESSRDVIRQALRNARYGATGFHAGDAMAFATRAMRGARNQGEVVYAGPALTSDAATADASGLRMLNTTSSFENVAIVGISVRPAAVGGAQQVLLRIRNNTARSRSLPVALQFGGAPLASRPLTVAAGGEAQLEAALNSSAAGVLDARVFIDDDFAGDDRAQLEIPARRRLRIGLRSADPARLRALLETSPSIEVVSSEAQADVVVLEGGFAAPPENTAALWIDPRSEQLFPGMQSVANTRVERWAGDSVLTAGLASQDARLPRASTFRTMGSDIPLATAKEGVVAYARSGARRMVVLGFHPLRDAMEQQLAGPLLLLNSLAWLRPDISLQGSEVMALAPGAVELPLQAKEENISVVEEDGRQLPATLQDGRLRFHTSRKGIVQVRNSNQEVAALSFTLPATNVAAWKPTKARRGLPPAAGLLPEGTEWWPWLAALAAILIMLDWFFYGTRRRELAAPQRA
jgi:hypothetical protein